MWVLNSEREPTKEGMYYVRFQIGEQINESNLNEDYDFYYADGGWDYQGYRQLIYAWWEPEPVCGNKPERYCELHISYCVQCFVKNKYIITK